MRPFEPIPTTDDALQAWLQTAADALNTGPDPRGQWAARLTSLFTRHFPLAPLCTVRGAPSALARVGSDPNIEESMRGAARRTFAALGDHPEMPRTALRLVQEAGSATHRGVVPIAIDVLGLSPSLGPESAPWLLPVLTRDASAVRPRAAHALARLLPTLDDATAVSTATAIHEAATAFQFEERIATFNLLARDRRAWQIPTVRSTLLHHATKWPETAIAAMPALVDDPSAAREILQTWGVYGPRYEHLPIFHAAASAGVRGYPPEAILELATAEDPAIRFLSVQMAALVQGTEMDATPPNPPAHVR
jgi:hypothetical protein